MKNILKPFLFLILLTSACYSKPTQVVDEIHPELKNIPIYPKSNEIMVESFWRYLDKPGKLWGDLSQNSYGVYIIHVIMIGIFGTLLLNTGLPAVVKYLLLIVSTYVASNLIVSGYRSLGKMIVPSRSKSTSATTEVR